MMDALPFDLDKLIKICRVNDAAMVGIFGFVARGEDTSESDIDLMVKFSKRKSLSICLFKSNSGCNYEN